MIDIFQDIDPADLIAFAEAWAGLGWAVREQVIDVMDNGVDAECNPNAIHEAKTALASYPAITVPLDEWIAAHSN
jgi:hypothetical protein